jgi:hypothetical protein
MSGSGETRNLSSGGVLFSADTKIDIGEPIEYVITLNGNNGDSVDLHCLGKVMRLGDPVPALEDAAKPYQIAATLERYEFVRPAK